MNKTNQMSNEKPNIYEKLQTCRVEFQKRGIEKSGLNKYSGYKYFELSDILPIINQLFDENKLCSVISFDPLMAILTIFDSEKPEGDKIIISSPMAEANLKGCHPVQNLGATETYQRRYLYMVALEIVESDVLDATTETGTKHPGQINMEKDIPYKNEIEYGASIPPIKARMTSKFPLSNCYFCGRKHIQKGIAIVCIELEGKDQWGAEECYNKHRTAAEKQAEGIEEEIPLPNEAPPQNNVNDEIENELARTELKEATKGLYPKSAAGKVFIAKAKAALNNPDTSTKDLKIFLSGIQTKNVNPKPAAEDEKLPFD